MTRSPREHGTHATGVNMARSKAMLAVCTAAGWPYCEEHDRPRYHGEEPCWPRHTPAPSPHDYWCVWPDGDCRCGRQFDGGDA